MNTGNHFDICSPDIHVSQRIFSSPRARILLIEDEPDIADEVINDLMERGYLVDHSVTGTQGAADARRHQYDLLIVDLLLPGCGGLSIIQGLRRDGFRVPVLVVSALGAVNDCVRGLKIGGDDYLANTRQAIESVGRPIPFRECKIVDPVTNIVRPIGEPGELLVRGFSITKGYWNDYEKTKQAINDDGW